MRQSEVIRGHQRSSRVWAAAHPLRKAEHHVGVLVHVDEVALCVVRVRVILGVGHRDLHLRAEAIREAISDAGRRPRGDLAMREAIREAIREALREHAMREAIREAERRLEVSILCPP
jgi:hypothetical protein